MKSMKQFNKSPRNVISKSKVHLTLIASFLTFASFAQNVGINTTGAAPDPSAALDVSSNNRGFLVPRMTQVERNAIASPATGLIIYQTDNMPGYYYFNGLIWVMLQATNLYTDDGTLAGNRTVTMGSNNLVFNGTGMFRLGGALGSQTFSMGGNGVFGIDAPGIANQRFVVLENGNVGIGINAPSARLQVVHPGIPQNDGVFSAGDGNRTLFVVNNTSTGGYNSVSNNGDQGIFFTNDNGNGANAGGLVIAPWNGGSGIKIQEDGNVGVGVAAPTHKLHVDGTTRTTNITNAAGSVTSGDLGVYGQLPGIWNRYVTNSANHSWYVDGSAGNGWSGNLASMTLTPAGNLGIGTTGPAARLEVAGAGGANVDFLTSGRARVRGPQAGIFFDDASSGDKSFIGYEPTIPNGAFSIYTPGSGFSFNFLNNGNLGVGTATPTQRLSVQGAINNSDQLELSQLGNGDRSSYIDFHSSGAPNTIDFSARILRTPSADGELQIYNSGNNRTIIQNSGGYISLEGNGNVGIGTTAPAARLEVNGQIKINGGSPGAGKILTSDANGLATWSSPAPITPAFHETRTASGSSNINFNAGILQLPGDGGFTAPVSGKYLINVHSHVRNNTSGSGTKSFNIHVLVNNASVTSDEFINWVELLAYFTISHSRVVYLNAGDNVKIGYSSPFGGQLQLQGGTINRNYYDIHFIGQ